MESGKYQYQEAWKQHRLLMRLLAIPIPVVGLLLLLTVGDSFATWENLLLSVMLAMILALLAIYARLMFWRCPRCGEFYFGWTRDTNPTYAVRCKNCNLCKYEGSSFD